MRVFFTNYHISVNKTLVDDLLAIGLEVMLPDEEFAKHHIGFYAPNTEHNGKAGAYLVNYPSFIRTEEPIVILIPCMQLVADFMKLYEERGKRDIIVLLTANSDHTDLWKTVPTDFLMSHDLTYHRMFKGKYKMLYFNRPTLLIEKKTHEQLRQSYDGKKINLYINNLEGERYAGLNKEYEAADEMQRLWKAKTGWKMPMYGYGNADGWPSMNQTQKHIVDSMFTFVSKRRETWGQLVNESMLLGTPCMFLSGLFNSTFKEYLITEDTAIIGKTISQIVDKALSLSFEQYETLVNEAYSQSDMYCDDGNRKMKLSWLFDKVGRELENVAR